MKGIKIELKSKRQFERLLRDNSGKVSQYDDTPKKMSTLDDQYNFLWALKEYVSNPDNKRHLIDIGINGRQAGIAIDEKIALVQDARDDLKELLVAQRNFASRVIVPTNDGEYAGNGKCYIQFVNVGMGDCSLITTPSGKTIMIDLGTAATSDIDMDGQLPGTTDEIIRSYITSKLFLNQGCTLDLLLLTHPDKDHYNKLKDVLTGPVSAINRVYYGGTEQFSSYHKQSTFITSRTKVHAIKCVVLRESESKIGDKIAVYRLVDGKALKNRGTPNTIGNEYEEPVTGEIVLYYETVDDQVVFKLSILAANVHGVWVGNNFVTNDTDIKGPTEMKLPGEPNNVRSLVVLATCYGRKILITGDATAIPEQFMANHYPDILKEVDTLRFGHHGSPTSSSRVFVQSFQQLKRAVASTGGKNTVVHHLPKIRIIQEYINKNLADAGPHVIYAYEKDDSAIQRIEDIRKSLFTTGSNGTIQFVETKTTSLVKIDNKVIFEQTYDHNS